MVFVKRSFWLPKTELCREPQLPAFPRLSYVCEPQLLAFPRWRGRVLQLAGFLLVSFIFLTAWICCQPWIDYLNFVGSAPCMTWQGWLYGDGPARQAKHGPLLCWNAPPPRRAHNSEQAAENLNQLTLARQVCATSLLLGHNSYVA